MSDQPRPSHELFHDVTDTRPRAGRATGGTLAVSIVAHALILAAVIVVPLLATDTLPKLADTVGVFTACRAAATRSASAGHQPHNHDAAADASGIAAPVEAPDEIGDEPPRAPSVECTELCRRSDRRRATSSGVIGGTGDGDPAAAAPAAARPAEAGAGDRAEHADEGARRRADLSDDRANGQRRGHGDHRGGDRGRRHGARRARAALA